MFVRFLVTSVFVALLSSCGVTVSQPQPFPKNYKAEVREKLDTQLYDGAGARIKWQGVPFQMGQGDKRRYYAKFLVNAKNLYGGYTGFKPWSADFIDGRVNYVQENPFSGLLKPQ